MFWRNVYESESSFNNYLNSKERSNYVYSETEVYRKKPIRNRYGYPCLMRKKTSDYMDDRYKKYNSNTNNPDDGDWDERRGINNDIYSEEECYDSNYTENCESDMEINDLTKKFGSNNANSKKITDYQEKLKSRWFQKNMYGLPSESEEANNYLSSEIISDDEQIETDQFNSNASDDIKYLNRNTRHKKYKTSLTSNKYSGDKKLNFSIMACSPTAMIIYMFRTLWNVLLILSCSRYLKGICGKYKWYYLPVTFPIFVISRGYQYIVSLYQRIKLQRHKRSISTAKSQNEIKLKSRNFEYWCRLLFGLLWLLFWIFFAFFMMSLLMWSVSSNRTANLMPTLKDDSSTMVFLLSLFTDKQCLKNEPFLDDVFSEIRRAAFCIFSYPARWAINVTNISFLKTSTISHNSLPKSNTREMDEILKNIQKQLIEQESKLSMYMNQQNMFQKESDSRIRSLESKIKREDFNILIQKLQDEFVTLKQQMLSLNNSVKVLSDLQVVEMKNVTKTVETVKEKLEKEINNLLILIEKVDHSIHKTTNPKLENSEMLNKLINDFGVMKTEVNDMVKLRNELNQQREAYVKESENIKTKLLVEMNLKLKDIENQQNNIRLKFNNELSKLENSLENSMKEMKRDEKHVNKIMQNHLNNMKIELQNEINSTLWDTVSEKMKNSIESKRLESDIHLRNTLNSEKQNNMPCYCRPMRMFNAGYCLRLNDIRKVVNDSINLFAADRIARADFALESAGGTIANIGCTETYNDRAATLTLLGVPLVRITNSPRTIIQPNVNPGECWAMKGSNGQVIIQLSGRVLVDSITIDHIPKSLSPTGSISSAIKKFEIQALENEADKNGISLGNFTYNIDSEPIQTFMISKPIETNFIKLMINSNNGNLEYTCIYRIRVHGKLIRY